MPRARRRFQFVNMGARETGPLSSLGARLAGALTLKSVEALQPTQISAGDCQGWGSCAIRRGVFASGPNSGFLRAACRF